MATRNEHWNKIFSNKSDPELGWFERDFAQTLKFFEQILPADSTNVFLPGAGTSLLVEELLKRRYKLVLNDISDEALNKLKARVGTHNSLNWLHHDISKPIPDNIPLCDIWIDRAVLHFLLDVDDIQGYFKNLETIVKPGGYALFAEFSMTGAQKCAGLEVHRYSIEEITARIGKSFELVKHEYYTYINPAGDPRPFIYALYRKHRVLPRFYGRIKNG